MTPEASRRRLIDTARATRRHLRLFESGQILIPGLFGILKGGTLPPPGLLALYLVAYGAHVLSVYSYNDYCDLDADSLNPRKRSGGTKSRRWLRNQTLVLVGIFLLSASALPSIVGLLLLANQVLCMAYSAPGIRLKARLLGSESAHFFAGFTYYLTGAIIAGGSPHAHWMGGLLFGVLYVSGGTFNEIMDRDADEVSGLHHLAVRVGRRRSLWMVVALHALAFVLVLALEPSVVVLCATAAAIALYGHALRLLLRDPLAPTPLLAFRRRYRLLFAALLLILGARNVLDDVHAFVSLEQGEEARGFQTSR